MRHSYIFIFPNAPTSEDLSFDEGPFECEDVWMATIPEEYYIFKKLNKNTCGWVKTDHETLLKESKRGIK